MNIRNLALTMALCAFLTGCGKEIDYKEVNVNNGLIYKFNDSDPYTGTIKNDPLRLAEINESSLTFALTGATAGSCNSEVVKGKYDGEKVCYEGDKKIAEIEYKDGKLDGIRKVWNPKNGKLISESQLKNGKKSGLHVTYNPESGNKSSEENYDNGKLSGPQKKWGSPSPLPNGALAFEESELTTDLNWDNGKKSGMTLTTEISSIKDVVQKSVNGEVGWVGNISILEENWKDDALSGVKREYKVDIEKPKERVLKYEGEYKSSNPVGVHKWYSGGNIVIQKEYTDSGDPIGGFERKYLNGTVVNEIKYVPVSDKKGKSYLGKMGEEKIESIPKSGKGVRQTIEWNGGRMVRLSVTEYLNGNAVSEKNYSDEKDDSTGEYQFGDSFDYVVDLNKQNTNLKPNGLQREYDNGKLVKEEEWKNGNVVGAKTFYYKDDGSICTVTYIESEIPVMSDFQHPSLPWWKKSSDNCVDSSKDPSASGQGEDIHQKSELSNDLHEQNNVDVTREDISMTDEQLVKPSFDCAKASTTNEKLICGDSELSKLDSDLYSIYLKAKSSAKDPAAFKNEAISAFKIRETTCSDKPCLMSWYTRRKEVLSAGGL